MSSSSVAQPISGAPKLAVAVPNVSAIDAALWLTATTFVAALAYYFLGFDQGAVSVFGSDTHVHEYIHDARHFLGFPCH